MSSLTFTAKFYMAIAKVISVIGITGICFIAALLIYGAKTSCSGVAVYVKCHDFWDMPTFLLTALILGAVGVIWSAYNTKKINDRSGSNDGLNNEFDLVDNS